MSSVIERWGACGFGRCGAFRPRTPRLPLLQRMDMMLRQLRLVRLSTVAMIGLALAGSQMAACGGGSESTEPEPEVSPAPSGATTAIDAKAAAEGKQLATANGCVACHSADGASGVGPTWKGVYGHSVTLDNGSTVTADDAFLEESIISPNAKIAKGFTMGAMPTEYGKTLNETQIRSLVEYIKSLK